MADSHDALLAHLFRRAGFGLRPADYSQFPTGDYHAVVDALVNPPVAKRDDHSATAYETAGDQLIAATSSIRTLRADWLKAMVSSRAPLVERMTLFLSNHFATAFGGRIDTTALIHQHAKIRTHALGNFAELTHAMIDDLALARYLNNDRNRKGRLNENLGRELMELFLLGVGNYTETDVKEVARSLTGYKVQQIGPAQPELVYDETLHDDGVKTVLGTRHNFTPHGVADFLLAQPVAKRFVATKLVTTFVSPTPDPVLVGTVAKSLSGWDLKAAMRTIFVSSHFRAEAGRQSLAKTPAEYIVGIMRGLRRTEYDMGSAHMGAAGQSLFSPPSVAGWPTGRAMLGSGAMLARYNAASWFATEHAKKPASGLPTDADYMRWAREFGIVSLSPTTREALDQYKRDARKLPDGARIRGVLTLLLSSPEFQLA